MGLSALWAEEDVMEREPSSGSSNIESVGYDDDKGVMEVEFKGGSIYHYTVERQVFEDWQSGGFRGKYFHTHIRRLYEGTKQPREDDGIKG